MGSTCLACSSLRRLHLALLLCVHLVVAAPSIIQAENLTGKWEATVFFSRITVDMEHDGPSLRGVLVVHAPSGEASTYHFEGTFLDGHLNAHHHSGHAFSGELSENTLAGTLTMKTGEKVPFTVSDFHRIP